MELRLRESLPPLRCPSQRCILPPMYKELTAWNARSGSEPACLLHIQRTSGRGHRFRVALLGAGIFVVIVALISVGLSLARVHFRFARPKLLRDCAGRIGTLRYASAAGPCCVSC